MIPRLPSIIQRFSTFCAFLESAGLDIADRCRRFRVSRRGGEVARGKAIDKTSVMTFGRLKD